MTIEPASSPSLAPSLAPACSTPMAYTADGAVANAGAPGGFPRNSTETTLHASEQWGGAGRGQGRKPISDEPTHAKPITMPASYWEFVRNLGGGNASLGVRRLVEAATISHMATP